MAMKILVTGGCGFIGTHLVRAAQERGWDVVVLDSMISAAPSPRPGCAVLRHTVTNFDACLRAMRGVHLVYHLAARSDWTDRPQHPAKLFSVNTHGTVEVLTAARIAGVQKVIFTSSAAVYGNCAPGRESDRCHPVTIYGASKLAAEEACRGFIELGLDVTILRLFTVWGEGGHSAVERFRSDSQPAIHGDGSQSRDFVHVDDVVSALLAAYTWEPGVYNIGTGVETSILGLWRLLRSDEPVFAPWRPQDILRSFADITKVTSTTTWRPRRLLHEELAR